MGVDGNHDRNNVDIYSGSAIKHHIVLGYKLFGGGEGGKKEKYQKRLSEMEDQYYER